MILERLRINHEPHRRQNGKGIWNPKETSFFTDSSLSLMTKRMGYKAVVVGVLLTPSLHHLQTEIQLGWLFPVGAMVQP